MTTTVAFCGETGQMTMKMALPPLRGAVVEPSWSSSGVHERLSNMPSVGSLGEP